MTWRAAPLHAPTRIRRASGLPSPTCWTPVHRRQRISPRTAGPRRPMGRPAWQRQKALIIAGNGARNEALIDAASNIARALKAVARPRSLPWWPGSQQRGAGHAGPACRPLEAALERMEGKRSLPWSFLRTTSTAEPRSRVDAALDRLQHLLVIDHQGRPPRRRRIWCCLPPVLPKAMAPWSTWKAAPSASSRSMRSRLLQRRYPGARGWRWLDALQGRQQPRSVRWNWTMSVAIAPPAPAAHHHG